MTADLLHRRSRQAKSRWLARRREYRQRHLAAGVWFRVRRCLAHAAHAYVLSPAAAKGLEEGGIHPEPAGLALEPPLRLYVVSGDRLASVPGLQEIQVRLGVELLAARHVALIPFDAAENADPAAPGAR